MGNLSATLTLRGQNFGNFSSCILGNFQVLDLACNTWQSPISNFSLNRKGHGLFYRKGKIFVVGGDDGSLRNDLSVIPLQAQLNPETERDKCRPITYCGNLDRCQTCSRKAQCKWCNSGCAYDLEQYPLGNLSIPDTQELLQGSLSGGLCPANSSRCHTGDCYYLNYRDKYTKRGLSRINNNLSRLQRFLHLAFAINGFLYRPGSTFGNFSYNSHSYYYLFRYHTISFIYSVFDVISLCNESSTYVHKDKSVMGK